jgi:tRNA pseudouridine55 synthase
MLPIVTSIAETDFHTGALLLVNKPKGWTSFDVVNKIRYYLRKKYGIKNFKVGHSGTLDPMATGLLLICTGKWTKELHQLIGLDKVYIATITLGIETDSYDAEGNLVATLPVPPLSPVDLLAHLEVYRGVIDQHPPAFSAIKKDGKKLYELARAGKEVITEARKVIVHDLQLMSSDGNVITLMVHCGSGFYVRSLAHDLGKKIGCGAHLSGLVRTQIGGYNINDAIEVEEFVQKISESPV